MQATTTLSLSLDGETFFPFKVSPSASESELTKEVSKSKIRSLALFSH